MNQLIEYHLRLISTSSATGYFGCVPVEEPGIDAGLVLLRERPYDDFLRQYLLSTLAAMETDMCRGFIETHADSEDSVVAALVCEFCDIVGQPIPAQLAGRLPRLQKASSLLYVRALPMPDRQLHHQWIALFEANLRRHRPLPAPRETGLPMLYDQTERPDGGKGGRIETLYSAAMQKRRDDQRPPPEETAALALEKLQSLNVLEGEEARHAASLSPIAFLRRWRLQRRVFSGRNRYSLSGIQTSYGKGLSPEAARASCLMEIVERVSSFAAVENDRLPDHAANHHLIRAPFEELRTGGTATLNPNRMALEVPYSTGTPLYWMTAADRFGRSVQVPVQSVFLFSNLDEVSLCSSLGSTGLASGNSLAEAKVSALLEVIERDADAVAPYQDAACFALYCDNPYLTPLFEAYRTAGIAVRFQEITTEFGVPCYRAFVVETNGNIVRATGAHLDGRKAVMSALTETTYPFPGGPPSADAPAATARVKFEDLPNFDTNSSAANLEILETLLSDRGYEPVYVDLTRADLNMPVVKALVPGLEWMADFDRFSRVPARLWANYLSQSMKGATA
jgi:ribosomal protein S12 methylthiotransferase accessory factor